MALTPLDRESRERCSGFLQFCRLLVARPFCFRTGEERAVLFVPFGLARFFAKHFGLREHCQPEFSL